MDYKEMNRKICRAMINLHTARLEAERPIKESRRQRGIKPRFCEPIKHDSPVRMIHYWFRRMAKSVHEELLREARQGFMCRHKTLTGKKFYL